MLLLSLYTCSLRQRTFALMKVAARSLQGSLMGWGFPFFSLAFIVGYGSHPAFRLELYVLACIGASKTKSSSPGRISASSFLMCIQQYETSCQSQNHQYRDDACTLINVYEYASAKKEDKHPDEHQADGVVPSHGEYVSNPLLAMPHSTPRMRLHRLLNQATRDAYIC